MKQIDIQNEGSTRELPPKKEEIYQIELILLLDCDVGNWAIPLSVSLRIDIIKRRSQYFQNKGRLFEVTQRTRSGEYVKGQTRQLVNNSFYKHLLNGKKVLKK